MLKGSIVVKKAYCDWDRYKEFKASMHEAAFELIEIPHVRQSGKNSADIRMVVDALDLCYTKIACRYFRHHQRRFGFLAAGEQVARKQQNGHRRGRKKLHIRPADRQLRRIHLLRRSGQGNGKESRKSQNTRQKETRHQGCSEAAPRTAPKEESDKKQEALDLVMGTVEALFLERGEEEKIWGSMVKQALKRRQPGFNESYYGFGSFSKLLDEAAARKLLEVEHDEKSGGVIIRNFNPEY